MRPLLLPLLLVSLLGGGCASFERQGGFSDVQALVTDKGVGPIRWTAETGNERPLDEALTKLLNGSLDAQGAVTVALLNNRGLQALYEELGIAQADLLQAGLLQNPVFSVERRFSGKALELDVAQGLLGIFLIPLRKRAAAHDFEAAKLRVAHAVVSHAAQTQTAFYDHEAQRETIEALRQTQVSSEAAVATARELRRAGNVAELEVLSEMGKAAETRLELSLAQVRLVASRERLNVLMGLSGPAALGWKSSGRLPPVPDREEDPERLETLATEQRLDLSGEKEELRALEARFGLAGYVAALDGAAAEGHFEREPGGGSSVGPSLSIPLPLFDQGRLRDEADRASLRQAAARYLQHAVEIRSEVRLALAHIQEARLRAAYVEKELIPLRRRILAESLSQYNGMFLGPRDLLGAQREAVVSMRARVEALRDYWSARVELAKAVGGTLPRTPGPASGNTDAADSNESTEHHHHHHGG